MAGAFSALSLFLCLALEAALAGAAELAAGSVAVDHGSPAAAGSPDAALIIDDECDAGSEGESCGMHALQLKARATPGKPAAPAAVAAGPSACQEAWCAVLDQFSDLFDSNNPYEMQKAVDTYAEYASRSEGIKLAVTRDSFYEMYHSNVAWKLNEYLPQHLFAWSFNRDFAPVHQNTDTEATVMRTGNMTFNLGWWKRSMFWKYAVKTLPHGQTFPFSQVHEFNDCANCPAKMMFNMKKGGLDGDSRKGWKITGITLIKLE